MALSEELQKGKAAEHLVCADLILQGYNAFLSDQGLPYDIIVDTGYSFVRVQVKSCSSSRDFPKSKQVYRFSMRYAKRNSRLIGSGTCDVMAFVALDIRMIAYMSVGILTRKDGKLVSAVELRTINVQPIGREYPGGAKRILNYCRNIESYGKFGQSIGK